MHTVEILHTPGCANARATRAIVEGLVEQLLPGTSVVLTDVGRHPQARERFAGSPTVLVDGQDIQPEVERSPGAG